MNTVIASVLIVSGLGLLIGVILAIASNIFSVSHDEKAEQILSLLPGVNCGACGYSGCMGYASALSAGTCKNGLCSPGGEETAKAVAALLGLSETDVEYKTAFISCMRGSRKKDKSFNYRGNMTCSSASSLFGGPLLCGTGCIGLLDCAASCEYGAITVSGGITHIDPQICRGCSKCLAACPKGLISFVRSKKRAAVLCKSCDKASDIRKNCGVGCIGCKLCVKQCEYGAITVENKLAFVDPYKCTACGKCAVACPQKCITMLSL